MATIESGDHISALLARRKEMELERGDGEAGHFLFGWQCANPFATELLQRVRQRSMSLDHISYAYLEDNADLPVLIANMHESFGEDRPTCIFCGAGAMSIIFTFVSYLRTRSITEIYYLPPIYFSFHYALRLFGIRARPISAYHAFEAGFKMNLPNKETVLIVSDPTWYAAQPISPQIVFRIKEWQERTKSVVFVDGSFQYMRWDGTTIEPTFQLDHERTIRLISPTKSLAVSGYRFAYCLLPKSWRNEFSHTYTNIYGSANADSIAFGIEGINAMTERKQTNQLISLMTERHKRLREEHRIESSLSPKCGFFSFEKVLVALPEGYLKMGGEFFDQPRFPEHVRINLLSPSLHLLFQ